MSYLKTEEFSYEHVSMASSAKALSHPARVAILAMLMENKELSGGAITQKLPLAASTVSQHLKDLKNAKLINTRRVGPTIFYSINEEGILKARIFFERLLKNAPATKI